MEELFTEIDNISSEALISILIVFVIAICIWRKVIIELKKIW